jgi:hypothetical protein
LDDSLRVTLGLAIGVALLYLGARLRRRSLQRTRTPKGDGGGNA